MTDEDIERELRETNARVMALTALVGVLLATAIERGMFPERALRSAIELAGNQLPDDLRPAGREHLRQLAMLVEALDASLQGPEATV